MLTRLATCYSSPVIRRALLPCAAATLGSPPSPSAKRFATTSAAPGTDPDSVIVLGAAGRDFHDFMTHWSVQRDTIVKCFTGTQIPDIEKRTFPAELCRNDRNGNRYPDGIAIYPESSLEELADRFQADTVTLAYSDLSYDTVQSLAARANAAGCRFVQLPPASTMLESTKPVIAVCASRTGVGKSQTTRYIVKYFKEKGLKVAVVRHPMPYDQDLNCQRCQRYETLEDMDKYRCTIEEREEYYRHIEEGTLLFAGVDYEMILRQAELDADVILWDGGNNDVPFFKPDLHICLVDALRPMDEARYYPGETNVRMADVVLVAKVNALTDPSLAGEYVQRLRSAGMTKHPNTPVLLTHSVVTPEAKDPATGRPLGQGYVDELVRGRRVLVVDDGPTLTHGGMAFGAGYVLARQLGAGEIVDPRPFARGSLPAVFERFPHLENVLPAMGYGEAQIRDLRDTIRAADCDTVVVGTPSDITHLMDLHHPAVMARYEMELADTETERRFRDLLDTYYDRFGGHHHHPPEAA